MRNLGRLSSMRMFVTPKNIWRGRMEDWHWEKMWTAKWVLSESWHSSTALKKYQNKKGCKLKKKTQKILLHKDLIALAQALWAESNTSLPNPITEEKRFLIYRWSASNSSSGTKDVLYFQTSIFKIQDLFVKLIEGILDISPQKYYLDSLPHSLPHSLDGTYFLGAIHIIISDLKQVSIAGGWGGKRERDTGCF